MVVSTLLSSRGVDLLAHIGQRRQPRPRAGADGQPQQCR
uniref:Uncharacterized protein n=1 Tax=Arundo donax TaxID=35708 RepID=A0A0A8YZE1_ARUDO